MHMKVALCAGTASHTRTALHTGQSVTSGKFGVATHMLQYLGSPRCNFQLACPLGHSDIYLYIPLQACDEFGNARQSGGDRFQVAVRGVAPDAVSVADRGDGSYKVGRRTIDTGPLHQTLLPVSHSIRRLLIENTLEFQLSNTLENVILIASWRCITPPYCHDIHG